MNNGGPGQAKQNNAVVWIVLGALGILGCGCLIVVGGAVLFPVFSQARLSAIRTRAIVDSKSVTLSLIMYSADNGDKLPQADHWMDAAEKYLPNKDAFRSLALRKNPQSYGTAFRKELSKANTVKQTEQEKWIMVFDSDLLSRNAFSGLETLPTPGRYGSGSNRSNIVGFMDGHAAALRDSYRYTIGKPGSRFK